MYMYMYKYWLHNYIALVSCTSKCRHVSYFVKMYEDVPSAVGVHTYLLLRCIYCAPFTTCDCEASLLWH